MADPTQGNRDILKKIFNAVTPDNAPFKTAKDDVLTPEARAKLDEIEKAKISPKPVVAQTEPQPSQESFVNPNATPIAQNVSMPLEGGQSAMSMPQVGGSLESYDKGAAMIAGAEERVGQGQAKAIGDFQNLAKDIDSQTEAIQKQKQEALDKFTKDDEAVQKEISEFKRKPYDFFGSRNTWQKIVGGIGLFLGSITPEGARNVQNIIGKEIDRDIELQEKEFSLLKDKKNDIGNKYKIALDKYGSDEAAKLAMKKNALMMTEFELKRLESTAKGQLSRGKLTMGRASVQGEIEKTNAALMQAYLKNQAKTESAAIPGWKGQIKDPVAAREFRTLVTDGPIINQQINKLLDINNQFMGGTFSAKARADAEVAQSLLIGKLRVAIAGPGTMSEGDRELIKQVIANPTAFFSLKGSNASKLNELKGVYNRTVQSMARSYGLQQDIPEGARKIE